MNLNSIKCVVGIIGGTISAIAGSLQVVKMAKQLIKEDRAKENNEVDETTAENNE